MFSDDWDYSDENCPKCGSQMAETDCLQIGCEDGWYTDEDGINGNSEYSCPDCRGTGCLIWCKECGWDETFQCFINQEQEQL